MDSACVIGETLPKEPVWIHERDARGMISVAEVQIAAVDIAR